MLLSVWDGLPGARHRRRAGRQPGRHAHAALARAPAPRARVARRARGARGTSLPAAAKDCRMNATELLAELRPPLEDTPGDAATLERILLAGPEPPRRRKRRLARPLAVAGVTAIAATAAFALVPSGSSGPVGLAGAAAALTEPDVLLHFKVTTTHLPSGDIERAETWQTPDGRRSHTRYNGIEVSYDQRARTLRGLSAQARRGADPHLAGGVRGQARPLGLARDLEPERRRRPAGAPPEARCAGTTRRCATSAARRSAGSTSTRSGSSAKRRSPTRPPAPRSRSCATRRRRRSRSPATSTSGTTTRCRSVSSSTSRRSDTPRTRPRSRSTPTPRS